MQLGLLDDAARLFKESGRFDYLNRLYQSAGIWNKAIKVCVCVCVCAVQPTRSSKACSVLFICNAAPLVVQVAKSSDRIHLKTTHYQYAKHLESIGDVDR